MAGVSTTKKYTIRHRLAVTICMASMLCFISPTAEAVVDPNQTLDQIVEVYSQNTGSWESTLQQYALQLFWLLAGIQFTWAALRMALRGSDLNDWLQEIVNQILFIGFFLTLLLNSSAWASAIVNSFRAAGSAAGGASLISPSNILEAGIDLAYKVWNKLSLFDPGDSLALAISAIIILTCFALIAAFLIVALVESYIVTSAGVLFMGFGGSRWTSDYALKVINYAVSVGAKLFVLQLLIGLGQRVIETWIAEFDASNNVAVLVIVGASIVFLTLTKTIPEIVQGLINGTSLSTNAPLVSIAGSAVATTGAAVAGGIRNAAGASSAVHGAVKLASEQLASSSDHTSYSKSGRMAALTGRTVKNLTKAGFSDLGGKLSGRRPYGNAGGRMGAEMRQQASDLEAERNKPKQPTGNQSENVSGNTIRPE